MSHDLDPKALQSLRAKLAFTEKLLARERDGLLAFDRRCRYIHWSPQMEAITGLRADEVMGRCAFEVFPFLCETGEDARFYDTLAGRPVVSKDRPFHVPESRRRGFYEASYLPIDNDAAEVVGGIAIVRDVTQERDVEQRLRETESRFRNMADASPVLLWMSGTDSLCTFFNATWLEFTGRALDQELGVGWAEGVHFEDFQRCMDTYVAAFNERRRFEMEYRLRRADGEYRWILDRGTPRYTPEGTFAGYIGSCVDITEHKRLEVELRKAVRDRDDFLSIASHELRTPLTTLILALDKIMRRLRGAPDTDNPLLEALRRDAEAADGQVRRLAGLVEDLLDVSRLASGRVDLDLEQTDLTQLVRDVAGRLEDTARLCDSRLIVDAGEPVRGRWDRARIERVLTNLVGNAIKYGAGKPVRIAVGKQAPNAWIRVKDEGIGIPDEDQARIFKRFERAVSTRHYGGFGLGLWIARQLIEAHDGRITVQSTPGLGATFTITVPLTPKSVEASVRGRP